MVPPPLPPPERDHLFCYAVVSITELPLLEAQLQRHVGLFSCDMQLVLSNSSAVLRAAGMVAQTASLPGSMDVERGGSWGSVMNAKVFLHAWRVLRAYVEGGWCRGWVIKLDMDTYFVPARFRHVVQQTAAGRSPRKHAFVWSLRREKLWLPGPLEVLSSRAMRMVLGDLDDCIKHAEQWRRETEQGWGRSSRAIQAETHTSNTSNTSTTRGVVVVKNKARNNNSLLEDLWLRDCISRGQSRHQIARLYHKDLLCWVGGRYNTEATCTASGAGNTSFNLSLLAKNPTLYCRQPHLVAYHPVKTVEEWLACDRHMRALPAMHG